MAAHADGWQASVVDVIVAGPTTTTTIPAPGTFAAVQAIFTTTCATPQCHVPPFRAQDLDLIPGVAFGELVRVASRQKPNVKLVKPGDYLHSYLYWKIAKVSTSLGVRMPNNGTALTAAQINSFKQWIDAGAQNN